MKKIISLFLVMMLLISLATPIYGAIEYIDSNGKTRELSDFLDTKGHWAHDTILKWSDYNIVSGYQGYFSPNNAMSRGDLCIVLDRLLGLTTVSYNFYTDLPNDSYYRDSILKCVAAGYVTGTSNTTVSPKGSATREQLAVIICRMFDIDTSNYNSVQRYADDANISSWARPSVYAMRRLGYMVGGGGNTFNPQKNITRAEIMTLLDNVAGTYIPKKDKTGQGTSFKSDFVGNLMTSRNIELVNSSVSRDLIMTPDASNITLKNTTINGRLFVMDKSTITLSNSKINQLYLKEGKSTVTGITQNIYEVYVAEYASESNIDAIPNRLVLEPGTRIKVNGTMYENTTNSTKTYIGTDIKNDIAAEQGYVSGGPKISGVSMSQNVDNVISVKNVRVTAGDVGIREIGVVWVNQRSNSNNIIPTYQNRDGIYRLTNVRTDQIISFDCGAVSGSRSYRVYVMDSNGLLGYSNVFTFNAFDFEYTLNILDKEYPKSLTVEMIMTGDNLPDISSVRVSYGNTGDYTESLSSVNLSLYTDTNSESKQDSSRYRRYTGTINSPTVKETGTNTIEYIAPTYFGYYITFKDGSIVNRYPVLSNVLPDGVTPMGGLDTGIASYMPDGRLFVKNNILTTRYIIPQEIGVVYKVTDSETPGSPNAGVNGWRTVSSNANLDVYKTISFDNYITLSSVGNYTYYAAYVRTSNGYWYGDVKRIGNDYKGDENGYRIKEVTTSVMGDNTVLMTIKVDESSIDKDIMISLNESDGIKGIDYYTHSIYKNVIYLVVTEIDSGIHNYSVRIYKNDYTKSNVMSVEVDLNKFEAFSISGKTVSGGKINYDLNSNLGMGNFTFTEVTLLNSSLSASVSSNSRKLSVSENVDVLTASVYLKYKYSILSSSSGNIAFTFSKILPLY